MSPEQFQRVQSLFERALELPAGERGGFAQREAGSDPEILHEVLKLLAAEATPVPTADLARGMAAPDATRKGELGSIRGYRLLEVLGKGGFGIVYRAQRREDFRQEVAIKVIKPGMDSEEVIARFEQERQALAVMDHPNIARILDGGLTDAASPMGAGRPYFVMELVQGQTITEYCDARKLGIRARLELFVQVCEAVQHAHLKRVIHRDLKPSNILVADKDRVATPKVIDFGVAKAIDKTLTGRTFFTETGQVIGTPEYMSPEQAGSRADIDTRTDVYGLGVILYELLVGAPPFDPRDLRSRAEAEMMRMIREVDPPTASRRLSGLSEGKAAAHARSTASIGPERSGSPSVVPPSSSPAPSAGAASIAAHRGVSARELAKLLRQELEWIPGKAMEKDRERRYETPRDLAEDVQRYLRSEAIKARPSSTPYRLRKWVRRNRIAVSIAGAMLLLAVAAGAMTISAWRAQEEGRRQRAIAGSMDDFLGSDLLSGGDPDSDRPAATVAELLDQAAAHLDDRFGKDLAVLAHMKLSLGRALVQVGEPERALPILQSAAQLYGSGPAADAKGRREANRWMGEAMWRTGSSEDAVKGLRALAAEMEASGGPEDPETIDVQHELAGACKHAAREGRFTHPELLDEAESLYKHVLAARTGRLGKDAKDTVIVRYNLALLTQERARAAASEPERRKEMFELSVAQMRQVIGDCGTSPDLAFWCLAARCEAASTLVRLNKSEDAVREFEAAWPQIDRLGQSSFRRFELAGRYARACLDAKQPERAQRLLVESLAGYQSGPKGRDLSETAIITAWLLESQTTDKSPEASRAIMDLKYEELRLWGLTPARLSELARRLALICKDRQDAGGESYWKARAPG